MFIIIVGFIFIAVIFFALYDSTNKNDNSLSSKPIEVSKEPCREIRKKERSKTELEVFTIKALISCGVIAFAFILFNGVKIHVVSDKPLELDINLRGKNHNSIQVDATVKQSYGNTFQIHSR